MLWTLTRTYVRGSRVGIVALIVVLQLIQTFASLLLPSLNADIIDRGVARGDIGLIWQLGAAMLGVTVMQAACSAGAIYLAARQSMGQGRWLRERVFHHVQRFSTADLRHFGAPSLITRCTNDVQQVQMVMFLVYELMVIAPLMGIGGVLMAIRQDAKLSLLLLVCVPVLALTVGLIMMRLGPRFRAQQEAIDRITDVLRAQLSGVRVIRAFRRQRSEYDRYDEANHELRAIALALGSLFALMFPLVSLIISASQVAVVWLGGHRISQGGMEVGSLTAYLNYLVLILMSVMMASFVFTMLPRAQVCAERINAVLTYDPVLTETTTPTPIPRGATFALEGASVHHTDASAPVLAPLDLEFRPGHTTAIIGSTGSGKTTLVSLLPRLRDTSAGRVSLGGIDVRDLDLADLRSRIAYVPQTSYLFSGTIATTVAACASERIDRDRLTRALESAQAAEFVAELDEGVDARVEAGGKNFSGGQRQRLAIARALYRDADLYIFDDSFSALDYATDAKVRSGLRAHVGDAAIVIVAQRIATIRHASCIIVLDHGHVVGRGTHGELVTTCPTYQEIVASQTGEEELA
ncbi:ABC transporter ATP-binding protein [Nanchangia anserum]|uniref:ABC transporter ATP-binding protein n=1 Tax=Nanchangia anserum TaxID=2692125 RepID=UPI001883D611|nr:ABC transporter ATP-binding protein [Nanchangia anserum]QOX81514.1 ABC transporter ATP-binding protein [Nanchangia anserum]